MIGWLSVEAQRERSAFSGAGPKLGQAGERRPSAGATVPAPSVWEQALVASGRGNRVRG